MDFYLSKSFFKFSIDEVFVRDAERGIFTLRIIPDVNSRFFPPIILRSINVSAELLSKELYFSLMRKINNNMDNDISFGSTIIQGGYYIVECGGLPRNLFKDDIVITREEDFFREGIIEEAPYREELIEKEDIISLEKGLAMLSDTGPDFLPSLYLYCFNVGQGDSSLLILPNGSAYLIDTNIYSHRKSQGFVAEIKNILQSHGLNPKILKGLIITHKHIDHLRGADSIIPEFEIEYFLMNFDYKHPTKCVYNLLSSAYYNIKNWININGRGAIYEGNTYIDTHAANAAPTDDENEVYAV
jgi:hypothetical protein